ncbi:response regulator transcription factor [Bifidobacterium sp. MA2]|uniref:Response regulator transcription factor n=1 Tax=Bifidobacterium santillanense TaxID=2809028 RepID=A0ABS5UMP1_9BIFI|nr:response regulator transcription factor [Bifidobacterium santillanense]MBT1172185.1 response regulator transcription factor [Bifidobacterium santillanense]
MDDGRRRFSLAMVDNDELTLGMLTLMVRRLLPEADVLWTCRDGAEAAARCLSPATRPDVLLVDMSLEGLSGVETCRRIGAASPDVALMGITSFSLERYAAAVLDAGARCLMDKAKVRDVCAVARDLAGGCRPSTLSRYTPYVSKESAAQAHARLAATGATGRNVADDGERTREANSSAAALPDERSLTAREREVMRLCATGRSTREIAETLHVGESTVKTYVMRAARKLGARNRTQAVARWLVSRG